MWIDRDRRYGPRLYAQNSLIGVVDFTELAQWLIHLICGLPTVVHARRRCRGTSSVCSGAASLCRDVY